MPELPGLDPELPRQANAEGHDDFASKLFIDASHRYPESSRFDYGIPQYIGHGTESFVVHHSGSADKVCATYYRENLDGYGAKKLYYTQKIFASLFPHNFPQIHAVKGTGKSPDIYGERDSYSGSVREMISGNDNAYMVSVVEVGDKESEVSYPFSRVREALKSLGISDAIDGKEDNFKIGDDGGEYYLDATYSDLHKKFSFNLENINDELLEGYMQKNNYSELDQKRVWSALKRLREIVDLQNKNGE